MKTSLQLLFTLILLFAFGANAQTAAKHPIRLDDLNRFHEVRDPQCSPDGEWIAYGVTTNDVEADKRVSRIAMVRWNGKETVQLTFGTDSDSSPRWSPDGKYLSFTSSRTAKPKGSQIWILDRRGGEAHQLTHFKNYSIERYEWSPDSKKLLLVMSEREETPDDAKTGDATAPKKPKPVVIDRYHFKQDIQGYLTGEKRGHVYVYDIAGDKLEQITTGSFEERDAIWSPDGTRIAFTSNRDEDPDRSVNSDVYVVEARSGAVAKKLTVWPGPDTGTLSWSADGKLIAYLQGDEGKYRAYNMNRLAVVAADGGEARVVTAKFDRGVSSPQFSQDGKTISVLVADDRSEYPATVSLQDGSVHRLPQEAVVVSSMCSRN